jgi:serine protease Do
MKRLLVLLLILVVIYAAFEGTGKVAKLSLPLFKPTSQQTVQEKIKVVNEQSVVIDVVKKVGPAVVTVGVRQPGSTSFQVGPFSVFFGEPQSQTPKESYIGSGFVVEKSGLIVTNKHVVSDTQAQYFVVDNDGKKYDIDKIYRDPLNDIAIIQVKNPQAVNFKTVVLGDSSHLQVGQFVIAIGTALGEFRNTVTTGVISGLGRGITAGNPFEGYVERLDNVIQTDAAINPGNSGGPLLNIEGEVIGVNTAIAQGGQNIGFAIPINVVKESLDNFNKTGRFRRPYLGVAYTIISRQTALLNDLPEGAYVQEVKSGSPAEKAGIKPDDIIVKIDGQRITEKDGGLAMVIARKKVGDEITIALYRDGKTIDVKAVLGEAPE